MVRSPVATEGSILATNSFVMFCHRFSNLYWAHLRKCLGVWEKAGRTRNYPYSTLVPTHPTFFPARIYPVGNPWFSHNDPYFFNGFCEVKVSYSLDMVLKDLGCLSNPTLTAKKQHQHKFSSRVARVRTPRVGQYVNIQIYITLSGHERRRSD